MKLTWNLEDLFKDNETFYQAIENIKEKVVHIKRYKNQMLDINLLADLLEEKWQIKELVNNVLIYGSLMYYKNIKSEECINLKAMAEKLNNDVTLELGFIDQQILNLGKEKINYFISNNPKLSIYKLSLDNLFRLQEHVQHDQTNIKIKEHNDGINEQLKLYNNTLRDITYGSIEIDGEHIEITSSNFAKYLASRDRETRKQTYINVNQNFKEKESILAHTLDKIFDYRLQNATLEKYNSVLEKVLFEENIDPNIVSSLIKAVNNNLNLLQKYLKFKTDFLEIEDPHLYDFGVPLDHNLKITYSFEEAISIIKNALKPLGSKYLEVVDILLDGHIDAIPDKNKHQAITFSWHTYSFMNFRGSYNDLKNMIHELGHIVNYYLSKDNLPYIYEDSTIFVGETASIINEILLNRYLYEQAKTMEEQLFYLSKEIENYVTSVFKQTMYTEFENSLYQTKEKQDLTSTLLSEKYESLIKKYYGNHITYDEVCNVEWMRLGHLYRWSYYPYKYATGLMIASVVVDALIDKHTLDTSTYVEFLAAGSSMYSLDLLKMLNIDLTDSNIINQGFKVMEQDIEKLDHIRNKTYVK